MKKPTLQKNTLLKNAQANAASNFFKRVFFSPPKKSTLPFFTNLFFPPHGFTANTNSCASNVNSFEQTVSELQIVVLRTNSTAAHNRVGGREQDCSRCASHTTVRTGHVYSGSLSCGATFK